jgi:hypothetical protein
VTVLPSFETVPLSVRTDAEHGGRWTSLIGAGREWLLAPR